MNLKVLCMREWDFVYSCRMCESWEFCAWNSEVSFKSLAVLVRHSQVQKCLQINLNPSNKLLWNLIFYKLVNWYLQSSITQHWKGLYIRAWFLHCLTLLHPETWLFANCSHIRSKHHGATFVLLCSSFFCWQRKVSICDSAKWLSTGFSEATWIHWKFLTLIFICNTVTKQAEGKLRILRIKNKKAGRQGNS